MNFRAFILFPFSFLYGVISFIRNFLFDKGLIRSYQFDIPVISVGNLSMGGTGKTPHVEYLIDLLQSDYNIATLSRGYGRRTKGFIEATKDSLTVDVGDEPRQYKQKYKNIKVFVCEDRVFGINEIVKKYPDTDLILLDDAYQHRRIKPGLNILLTDYRKLFTRDYVFPTGSLREFRKGYIRADIIVVTKSPIVLSPLDCRTINEKINLGANQKIFFSKILFNSFQLVDGIKFDKTIQKTYSILLFAGIANPYPLEEHLKRGCEELEKLYFRDHHQYTEKDMTLIKETFLNIASRNKIIVTTQKDAMRIEKTPLIDIIKDLPVYYVPIKVDFYAEEKLIFNSIIEKYAGKNN